VKQWQKYLAEFFGAFILVFAGTTAVVVAFRLTQGQGTVGAAEQLAPFAFGFALLAGLYAFGEVSGGHFNPAVSLAMFLDRRISAGDLVGYWIAQFAGAIVASAVMLLPFTKSDVAATATVPDPAIGDGGVFFLEAAFTAIFVVVILQASKSGRFGASALVAIPLTLIAIHFAIIPFTGSSVNPARTLGPAVIGNVWDSVWIYFLAPALGAIIAYVVHAVIQGGTDTKVDLEPAQGPVVGGETPAP
jgi:aquaporin Z